MIRVVLIDDHETVREGLHLLINSQADMQVVGEASDGAAGMTRVSETLPDVVVLDVTMPGMSGLVATGMIKAMTPHIAIVALTRHDDHAYVQQLMEAGASAYVLKQSASAELLRAIRVVAAKGTYLDPGLPSPSQARDPRRRAGTPTITERESDVLRRMAVGHSNKEIASALNISIKTVEAHKANAMRKLQLVGRTDVVRYAVIRGWLRDP